MDYKRINFHLSETQIARLKACADKTKISMVDHVRIAIDEYLDRKSAGLIKAVSVSSFGFHQPAEPKIESVAEAPVAIPQPEPQALSDADTELLRQRDADLQSKPFTVLKDRPMSLAKTVKPSRFGFQPATPEEKAERIERIFRSGAPKPLA